MDLSWRASARSLWISHGGQRARGGKRKEVGGGERRDEAGERLRGQVKGLGIGGAVVQGKEGRSVGVGKEEGVGHGETCHNDKPGLERVGECGESKEGGEIRRDQPQWQAGPWWVGVGQEVGQ